MELHAPASKAALSDQLTAYWLAEPEADHVAYCVFVKAKEPRVERHFAKRNAGHLAEYLAKVRLVAAAVPGGREASPGNVDQDHVALSN